MSILKFILKYEPVLKAISALWVTFFILILMGAVDLDQLDYRLCLAWCIPGLLLFLLLFAAFPGSAYSFTRSVEMFMDMKVWTVCVFLFSIGVTTYVGDDFGFFEYPAHGTGNSFNREPFTRIQNLNMLILAFNTFAFCQMLLVKNSPEKFGEEG